MEQTEKINVTFFQENHTLDNRAVGRGVYIVELLMKDKPEKGVIPLYIGQSVYMVSRGGEHLYNLFNEPEYFGFIPENLLDCNLELRFRVLEAVPTEDDLRMREAEYIKEILPVTQNPTNDKQLSIDEKIEVVQAELKKLRNQ